MAADATMAVITATYDAYQDFERNPRAAPDYPAPCTSIANMRATVDTLDAWLDDAPAALKGAPLSYVTREHVELPEQVDGEEDEGYLMPTRRGELKRRAHHTGDLFAQDNAAVFAMLLHVFSGNTTVFGWIRSFRNVRNGRGAYFAIRTRYMGADFQNRIKAKADRTLQSTFYDGKSRNFTLDACTSRLNDAFTDLGENGEPVSEAKKVRTLLFAVQDPNLIAAKARIIGDDALQGDFNRCATYMAAFNDTQKNLVPKRSIAAANMEVDDGQDDEEDRDGGRNRNGNSRGCYHNLERPTKPSGLIDENNVGRYYTDHEWRQLTHAEVKRVLAYRERRESEPERKLAPKAAEKPSKEPERKAAAAKRDHDGEAEAEEGMGTFMSRKKTRN